MKTTYGRTKIAHHKTGTRTIGGTDFPVVTTVEREQMPGQRPQWIVTYSLCNGVAASAQTFRTKWEAMTSATMHLQHIQKHATTRD